MFLGPVEIDFAGPHRLERALHSEGADIDVTEDQRDEQDRDYAVHDLRDLHSGDVGDVEWEQQQKAGERNRGTGAEDAPEHHLLSGIEPARRRVFRCDESTALPEPFNIDFVRNVVFQPEYRNQYDADHEWKTREVVRVFGGLRERAEGVRTDQW